MARVKMGIGRLVADPAVTPVVVPFYHRGMQNVLGIGEYNFVSSGKRVVITVGEPLQFDDLLRAHRDAEAAAGVADDAASETARAQRKEQLYRDIAKRVEAALRALKQQQEDDCAAAAGGHGK